MAKPNYSFEKRQREIAKKKKKEEKLAKKHNARPDSDAPEPSTPDEASTTPSDNSGGAVQ